MGNEATDPGDDGAIVWETHTIETTEGTLTFRDHVLHFVPAGSRRVVEMHATQIRRVQLDIELGRPATVVIVPNSGSTAPLMLNVEPNQMGALAPAIVHLAVDLDDVSRRGGSE